MKKMRSLFKLAIIIFVFIALVLPSSAVVSNSEKSSGKIKNFVSSCTKVMPKEGLQRGTDVLMPSDTGNDRLPSVTKDEAGHVVVTWTNEEDVSTWSMGIAYSDDPTDPMSWQGWIIELTETNMVWYSDTAYIDGPNPEDYHGLYGVNMYYDSDLTGGYQIPDITQNPDSWEFFIWEGIIAQNQVCRAVEDGGYYNDPYYGHKGPISMAIYHVNEMSYNIIGCPLYFNQDLAGDSTSYFYDAQAVLQTAPARDCDYATLPNWFHLTWEYHDTVEDIDKIVWKKIDPAVEADIEFTPWQEYIAVGTNPSIEAYEDGGSYNLAVVYVNNGTVECVYSNDDGENWEGPVTVATGSYPALRAIDETFYCAYINDGNLYIKTSDNGGISWSSAKQINDVSGSVVPEVNSVDIHPGGIVWVDGRGGDLDIYWDSFDIGSPPGAPTITGPDKGNPGKSYNFKFKSIDPDGHDVKYIIDWGDGDSDTTAYKPSGEELTISHSWSSDGTYTITAKAQDIYGMTSPETTKTVKMPRNKIFNLPIFLRILENHPCLFPILRELLGL